MSLTTLPATAGLGEVVAIIARDGGVVIDGFLDKTTLDGLNADLDPLLGRTPYGEGFAGTSTRRVSALFKHSRHSAAVILHPLYLGAAELILQVPEKVWYGEESAYETPSIQVGATQAIEIHPGQAAQILHRDDAIWQWRHPGGGGRDARLQIMLALTDFTAENGATHVIPGSHRWDDERAPRREEAVQAEMRRGSALLWLGSTYHGGGANTSGAPRRGMSIGLDLGNLRQEENQYLAVPLEIVRQYPARVQQLLGYQACPPLMGWIEVDGVMCDPSVLLQDELVAQRAAGF